MLWLAGDCTFFFNQSMRILLADSSQMNILIWCRRRAFQMVCFTSHREPPLSRNLWQDFTAKLSLDIKHHWLISLLPESWLQILVINSRYWSCLSRVNKAPHHALWLFGISKKFLLSFFLFPNNLILTYLPNLEQSRWHVPDH